MLLIVMFLVQDSWQLLPWIIGVQYNEWNVSPFWEAIDQLVYKFEVLRGCQILQMVAKSFYQCRFLVWSDHILRWINTNECYGCLKLSGLLCIDFVKILSMATFSSVYQIAILEYTELFINHVLKWYAEIQRLISYLKEKIKYSFCEIKKNSFYKKNQRNFSNQSFRNKRSYFKILLPSSNMINSE